MDKVKIIDAICGSRKTETMIKYINSQSSDKKILYVTPFRTEIERIKKSCAKKHFVDPKKYGTKKRAIKALFQQGRNIVTTHALFKSFDEEFLRFVDLHDYTLIMDEVADIIEVMTISDYDLNTLFEKYVNVGDRGKLIWKVDNYVGEFEKYKKLCDLESIFIYGDESNRSLIWLFPIGVFKAFKEVFVLTYLFPAQLQRAYFEYHKINFTYYYIKDDNITLELQDYGVHKYKDLIHICESPKINMIGEEKGALSYSWYIRNKNNADIMEVLKNNCVNFFKNITKTPSSLNMWTTFKEYSQVIKGKGYTNGFAAVNLRATNNYMGKAAVAYLVNRYMNPIERNFFASYGIKINDDMFALSELLQFIFRSRLRLQQEIYLYLPSKRMRNILKDWLDGKYFNQ